MLRSEQDFDQDKEGRIIRLSHRTSLILHRACLELHAELHKMVRNTIQELYAQELRVDWLGCNYQDDQGHWARKIRNNQR